MRQYVLKRPTARRLLIDYRRELNEEQYQAVTAGDGPILVIAGAGSGKTRVITYRVAWLVEHGVDQSRILLVTFTNKAAREMLRRVEGLLQTDCRRIWGGTFHHIGNRILREHAASLGYQPNYTILDSEDSKDLLEACVREAGIDTKSRRFPRGEVLRDMISFTANTETPLVETILTHYSYFEPLVPEIELVMQLYQKRKQRDSLMDYDDLLLNWKRLLTEQPEIGSVYAGKFLHILVDEYQDTNKVQAEIVDLLASKLRNVMVVGDDCQTIYSWRGTDFRNIYEFPKRYPDAKVYPLETNYRSTPQILDLANASIVHNEKQFPKELRALRKSGPKPALIATNDVYEQAEFATTRILELYEEGVPLSDIAVLYRSHYHSMELQIELMRRGLPYVVRSGLRFFEQAHTKDVIAYLRAVINPLDELAWMRILRMIPGIGQRTAERIWQAVSVRAWQREGAGAEGQGSKGAGEPRGKGVMSPSPLRSSAPLHPNPPPPPLLRCLIALEEQGLIPRRAQSGWQEFVSLMEALTAEETVNRPAAQIEIVLASGYMDYLRATYANAEMRVEDLRQLANFAARYQSTESFLSEVALIGQEKFSMRDGIYGEDQVAAGGEDEYLVMSSIHQAKGLEWRIVFLIWAADGRFPTARSLANQEAFEEERRLFYVATTRAKDELYVCYPLMTREGRRTVMLHPSRFVAEVDKELFERWAIESTG